MNSLQSLTDAPQLFVTLNPHKPPRPELVHATFDYDHPSYSLDAEAAQRQLTRIQGQRRTWFCGSYFGAGFHEDALTSGLAAAEAIGGIPRPWHVATGMPTADEPIISELARGAAA
ncbi:MAG: hypothetical protein HC834_07485 [Rhodospirillales bacterium]|nr:hypothetical protein [Rhodospirillales bacterium]